MTDPQNPKQNQGQTAHQPAILLPPVITALLGLMVAVHLGRTFVLHEAGDLNFVTWFGFIPVRLIAGAQLDGGWLPLLWTPVTHAFLHAGWEHLIINCAWLAIFGTPVARRYGAVPLLILFGASAIAGAVLFAATTLPQIQVLIGASGGIAGLTGAACRFMFQPVLASRNPETGEVLVLGRRTASLMELMREGRARFFIAMWLILNAAVPFVPLLFGESIGIAWQAHLAGFVAGLLMVPLFERHTKETGL